MTSKQINNLVENCATRNARRPELVETHISWVILCDQYVYKIKKPIQYSFLDFSTLPKRKYYCNREIELNTRLTRNIYIDVIAVRKSSENYIIDGDEGEIVDYAVRMHKMDREKQMDRLLQNNNITLAHIIRLADKIARFHQAAKIIANKDLMDLQRDFNNLHLEKDYLKQYTGETNENIITEAIAISDAFIERNKSLLAERLKAGFFRDCHGDLHCRNIFLLPEPEPFDCIEFDDKLREIDVLNEVAFLCMDLDAFGRNDLSELFFNHYNNLFAAAKAAEDYQLFIYYKSYRANIRAKVNSLRARDASDEGQRNRSLTESVRYLKLMYSYLLSLAE